MQLKPLSRKKTYKQQQELNALVQQQVQAAVATIKPTKKKEEVEEAPAGPSETDLLAEIRDLLKK